MVVCCVNGCHVAGCNQEGGGIRLGDGVCMHHLVIWHPGKGSDPGWGWFGPVRVGLVWFGREDGTGDSPAAIYFACETGGEVLPVSLMVSFVFVGQNSSARREKSLALLWPCRGEGERGTDGAPLRPWCKPSSKHGQSRGRRCGVRLFLYVKCGMSVVPGLKR